MNGDDERGLLWRLPVVRTKDLGKLGPGFAVGAGCGLGFGVGLLGGLRFVTSVFPLFASKWSVVIQVWIFLGRVLCSMTLYYVFRFAVAGFFVDYVFPDSSKYHEIYFLFRENTEIDVLYAICGRVWSLGVEYDYDDVSTFCLISW